MRIKEIIRKGTAKTARAAAFPYHYLKAKEILKETNQIRENEDDLVILLLKGIGDSAYGLSFIESLKEKYPSQNIIVIGNKKLQGFIESYPCIDRFIPYDLSKGDYKKYKPFLDCERIMIIGDKAGIFNTDPYQKRSGTETSAIELLRHQVFHLSDDCRLTYPKIANRQIESIDGFSEICSKIVIMNPYSNSISSDETELYEEMGALLREKGYIPYTNLVQGQEGISGTGELYCSIEEFAAIVERVAGVVSVRSGILDMVVDTGTPIFAVYSSCTERFKRIYDLHAWKGKSPIEEVFCDRMSRDGIMNRFRLWVETTLEKCANGSESKDDR